MNSADTLLMTGPEFQQVSAGEMLVTPAGGTQQTLAVALSHTPQNIGGIAPGTQGAAGTMYAGYTMAMGDDFNGAAADLVSAAHPKGKYFTGRTYVVPALGGNSPRGALNLGTADIDPNWTGHNDIGRGLPLVSAADLYVQSQGLLTLKGRQLVSGPETQYVPHGQLQGGGMISSCGAMMVSFPCIIECSMAVTPPTESGGTTGNTHPSFWLMAAGPVSSISAIEIDFEAAASPSSTFNCVGYDWSAVPGATQPELPGVALGANVCPSLWDGKPHLYAFVITATQIQYFVDSQLVNTLPFNMAKYGNRPYYFMFTPHSGGGFTWLTPLTMSVDYVRIWSGTGIARTPQHEQADLSAAFGAPFSFALPPASGVWGAGVAADVLEAIPESIRSPGGNDNGMFQGALLPLQLTYAGGTLSGTVTDQPGRLFMMRHFVQPGDACQPQRFALNVGPRILTPATVAAAIGTAYSHDVYADCDVGNLLPKSVTVSGLPAGLSYIPAGVGGGVISGTPTALGSYTITVANCAGQTATQVVTLATPTAGTGVIAPPVTAGLIGALDFDNLSLLTVASGTISAAAGAFGKTAGAVQATPANQPASTKNGYRFGAAFTNAGSSHMDWTSLLTQVGGAALTDALSIFLVYKLGTTSTVCFGFDIGQKAAGPSAERASFLINGATFFRYGAATTTDLGAADTLNLNMGTVLLRRTSALNTGGTNYVTINKDNLQPRSASLAAMGVPDTITVGARADTSTYDDFFSGAIFAALVFNRYVEDFEMNALRSWAHAEYGTP